MEHVIPIELPEGVKGTHTRHALAVIAPELLRDECIHLSGKHVSTGDYRARFSAPDAIRYPYQGNPDAVALVNTAQYASFVEDGYQGFHLPSRIRRWKFRNGKPYVIVMFRHYTPADAASGQTTHRTRQMMPQEIADRAEALRGRQRLAMPLGRDSYRQSKSYDYYRERFGSLPPELETLLAHSKNPHGYTWKASPYAGMRHVVAPTPGGGSQNHYMTFRTITPQSTGWYIPPSPGLHIMREALTNCLPDIQAAIDEAVAADIAEAALDAVEGA